MIPVKEEVHYKTLKPAREDSKKFATYELWGRTRMLRWDANKWAILMRCREQLRDDLKGEKVYGYVPNNQ